MKSPFTGGSVSKEIEWRELEYRKEQFKIRYHYYVCADTNERFTEDATDELNIQQVHNMYRCKYGIPLTEEIKAIRQKYDLSAAKMSEVLGFGVNVYRNYEAGEMPSVANGRLIRMAENTDEFRRLLYMARNEFDAHEYEKLLKKINHSSSTELVNEQRIENWLLEGSAGVYTGFTKPNLKKLCGIINFFAKENKPFTTGLNKLLFYADFGYFKQCGNSISGACYKAIQKGPIPDNYGAIYNYAVKKGFAKVTEEDFGEFIGDQFTASDLKIELKDLFNEDEIQVMKNVARRFKGKSTKEIVAISHKENAWQYNEGEYKYIDYRYGFELRAI